MGHRKPIPAPQLLLVGDPCGLNEALCRQFRDLRFEVTQVSPSRTTGSTRAWTHAIEDAIERTRPAIAVVSPSLRLSRAQRHRAPGQVLRSHLIEPLEAIELAQEAGVPKLLFVGSIEVYPGGATAPNAEEDIRLPRDLGPGSELAAGHLACMQMCAAYTEQHAARGLDYRSIVLAETFGPCDAHGPASSNPVHALIDRMHQARIQAIDKVTIPCDGMQRRDWLYVDDAARACLQALRLTAASYRQHTLLSLRHLCAGNGQRLSLMELAGAVARVVGYSGHVQLGPEDGPAAPDQYVDNARMLACGWRPRVGLDEALQLIYQGYLCALRAPVVCS